MNQLTDGAKTRQKNVSTVKIRLPKFPGAEDPVFVRVNSYTCEIKRGETVEVPWFVQNVLECAEQMEARADADAAAFRYAQ